jgi:hypothetical protein
VTRTVVYLGHRFTVPAAWPVIDLAVHPSACVRFDRPAVYLGVSDAASACPSRVLGTGDALLLQPAAPGAPVAAATDLVSHQISSTGAGIRATATYGGSPSLIERILASGALPVSSTSPAPAMPAPHLVRPLVVAGATSFTGKGFDPCTAPSTATMNAWKTSSPYGAIGIYIGGVNRGCAQPNLTASWVSAQAAAGWHFFPLYVGPQAPGACSGCTPITAPASQAQAAAQDAANQAAGFGFGPGSLIVYDMEAYSSTQTSTVLAFISAWTNDLHTLGYVSGEYSSLSSGISDLVKSFGSYTMPDVIDFADWNGQATTVSSGIPAGDWPNHQRIHQDSGAVSQTYGGVTISIDQDYLDVQNTAPTGTTHTVYALGPTNNYVAQWTGSGSNWVTIGGPAATLYAGGAGVFATDPNTGNIYLYTGTPGSWAQVGGPGSQFAEDATHLYGLGPDHNYVAQWTGTGNNWITIGGPATSIAAGG